MKCINYIIVFLNARWNMNNNCMHSSNSINNMAIRRTSSTKNNYTIQIISTKRAFFPRITTHNIHCELGGLGRVILIPQAYFRSLWVKLAAGWSRRQWRIYGGGGGIWNTYYFLRPSQKNFENPPLRGVIFGF